MNTLLLIFFALPVAIIIISIALQKIFRNPLLVAAIVFAIFLVVTFIIGDLIWLVATIAYTILAFITAVLTKVFCRLLRNLNENNKNESNIENYKYNNSMNSINRPQVLSIAGENINNQDDLDIDSNFEAGRMRKNCNFYRR